MQPDLIARIEAAQPSEARELFEEAFRIVWGADINRPPTSEPVIFMIAQHLENLLKAQAHRDAAAMFVPEGWTGFAPISDGDEAWLWKKGGPYKGHRISATTPYFALLAASLKARQTDERD